MKFSLFKRKKTTTVVKGTLVFLAVLSLNTVLFPQPAHAGFKEFLLSFATGSPMAVTPALAEEATPNFPVASDRDPVSNLTVIATAYSSDLAQTDDTPCQGAMPSYDLCRAYEDYGIEDTIAANFLPLGTRVRFPDLYGDKIFMVRDRMNARYNYDRIGYYRIDFYKAAVDGDGKMDSSAAKAKAIAFGVKRGLKMEILPYVK